MEGKETVDALAVVEIDVCGTLSWGERSYNHPSRGDQAVQMCQAAQIVNEIDDEYPTGHQDCGMKLAQVESSRPFRSPVSFDRPRDPLNIFATGNLIFVI